MGSSKSASGRNSVRRGAGKEKSRRTLLEVVGGVEETGIDEI
jgi:hypothetical protein